MARRFVSLAAAQASKLRKESLDLEAKWSQANIAFRRERAQAERDAFWEKVYQAQGPGSLLNYSERISSIERTFSRDFREVLARLAAARRGLREIYNYSPAFPPEGAAGYFDEVVAWVKSTKERLAQQSHLDQTYILALSVKDLAKSAWESGRPASQWTFDIPAELFSGQSFVRLRGLSLAVAGGSRGCSGAKSQDSDAGSDAGKTAGLLVGQGIVASDRHRALRCRRQRCFRSEIAAPLLLRSCGRSRVFVRPRGGRRKCPSQRKSYRQAVETVARRKIHRWLPNRESRKTSFCICTWRCAAREWRVDETSKTAGISGRVTERGIGTGTRIQAAKIPRNLQTLHGL